MSANDAKPTGGENKEVVEKKFNSPNIKSAADEVVAEPQLSEEEARRKAKETVAIDGIPIDEKDIKFRAKDIKEADTGKLFVKIEGAEERKKALIRDMEKQKAELVRKEENRKKQARHDERRAKNKATRETHRKRIANIFWTGKKKVLTISIIIIILILAIGGPLLWNHVVIPAINQSQLDAEETEKKTATNTATDKYSEAEEKMEESGNTSDAYAEAKNSFENDINEASDVDKVYLTLNYAQFVYNTEKNTSAAIDVLLSHEPGNVPNSVKQEYYAAIRNYYQLADNQEKVDEYNKKIAEYDDGENEQAWKGMSDEEAN